ncbi:bifunctional aconitate hydratase 2/2-methylisocitrate dehydratase [Natroniella acetigena]|uniref:bifunctional aconitate hydratase 2/2-methylisocitrate dehydratase n=1 Tax=Natroniella acetigena TaxID=52004 RepID=UPI00200A268A|nr:bifunctional aconitate hydratase 2/2-methylisocitrate dehydratase [Natroniella acetigena]MCK8827458.1 bifunctional aconitate hydratase 2/2-methylisocitrate dehydratase [Natroniella acetigena]
MEKRDLLEVLEEYKKKVLARKKDYDLSPRPLSTTEVEVISAGLQLEGLEKERFTICNEESLDQLLVRLLTEEVRRGTFPSSHIKAEGLAEIVRGELVTDYLSQAEALELLAQMKGGAAAGQLVKLLEEGHFVDQITEILKETVLINRAEFDKLAQLAADNDTVVELIKSWGERDFATDWRLEDKYQGLGIKVGDNITTGHLSPSKNADSRTDHPLHAQFIMEGREDEADFLERLEGLKEEGQDIFFVAGAALGEGSSRKSATYTMLQVLGKPVDGEPEKKEGGVVIAKSFAPIFKNSLVASAILPLECNTDSITEGDQLEVDLENEKLIVNSEEELEVKLPIQYNLDKIAAGGMTYFDAGNELQQWAIDYCTKQGIDFDQSKLPAQAEQERVPQTLAQKIVGFNRLDGKDTILPGETATVKIRGVYSQDTTGPMTLDEYQAMAGEDFGAEFVVQSLCHTGECPSTEDRDRHQFIEEFVTERGGVCLEPGEGIIHTIANRFVLPTDVVVGGDSHTRTPRGISFPAASDIVAGAMKYGKQDLTMDESVRVVFTGQPKEGITARDLVSTLVTYAEKTVGKDVYNGRIIEMEGVDFLDSDERYILTNAVAERSASAGVVVSDQKTIEAIENNLEYLKSRVDAETSPSVKETIASIEEFLADPVLLQPDQDAQYAAIIEIPLDEVEEPLVAKPHHPDNVAGLSEVGGVELDEIFIGSCVGGDLESIQAAARILEGKQVPQGVNFVVCPASRDIYNQLAQDGSLASLTAAGATITMPGCGLCMGNKRRIGSGAIALTTTTRNYQSRIGPADSKTYLGGAHVAAVAAILGRIPTAEEYFEYYK